MIMSKGWRGADTMKKRARGKGLLEKKLGSSDYRKRFKRGYQAFLLEVQMLKALEEKCWTYEDLAKATHTKKSNISRDLRAHGIHSASYSRIKKMAHALDYDFVPLLIPHKKLKEILPRIERLIPYW